MRRWRNNDRVRLRERLKPRCEVGRLPYNGLLLCHAFAKEFADDHKAGCDPNTDFRVEINLSTKLERHFDQTEACSDCSFGVVFIGPGIAEVNKHAIAHVFGYETAEMADYVGAPLLIGVNHLPQFLRIEARG